MSIFIERTWLRRRGRSFTITLKEKLSVLNPPDIAEFFEHINCNADYRKDMDIFVEWALKIKEEISMDNFYWYLNLKHIQRSGMNENYKKILANFDKDPINSIIKLAK